MQFSCRGWGSTQAGCTHRVPRACCSLCTGSVPRSLPRQGGDVWVQQHFVSGFVGGGSVLVLSVKHQVSGTQSALTLLSTVSPSLSSQTVPQPRQASRRTLGQVQTTVCEFPRRLHMYCVELHVSDRLISFTHFTQPFHKHVNTQIYS